MDNSPIPDYITRKAASLLCGKAERTLQRHWSRAIEVADKTTLQHLKLHCDDGEIHAGTDVSKALIEELKHGGKNPTWYASKQWVQAAYGESKKKPPTADGNSSKTSASENSQAATTTRYDDEYVELLVRQIEDYRRQTSAQTDLIKELATTQKQNNTLMQNLQTLLANERGLLPAQAGPSRDSTVVVEPMPKSTGNHKTAASVVAHDRSKNEKLQSTNSRQPESPKLKESIWTRQFHLFGRHHS